MWAKVLLRRLMKSRDQPVGSALHRPLTVCLIDVATQCIKGLVTSCLFMFCVVNLVLTPLTGTNHRDFSFIILQI